MILISGATGQLGGHVVSQLLRRNAVNKFAVLARSSEKAERFADMGIEVRIGDFDQPATLKNAFDGIERFLFISTMSMDRATQQASVVKAAVAGDVKHIYYTGVTLRDVEASAVRTVMQSHFDTEDQIGVSGLSYTFFRNTIYAEALEQILGPVLTAGGILLPGGDGKVPYALRSEMGEAIANSLLENGHENKTYALTAKNEWSFNDVAHSLSRVVGRAFEYQNISEERLKAELERNGLPEFMVGFTLGTIADIRNGQYNFRSNDLANLLGREPASLDTMIKQIFAKSEGVKND